MPWIGSEMATHFAQEISNAFALLPISLSGLINSRVSRVGKQPRASSQAHSCWRAIRLGVEESFRRQGVTGVSPTAVQAIWFTSHRFNELALTNALAMANVTIMLQAVPLDIVMRSLADPTRRAVFERIARADESTVAELTRGSGVTQSAISQHLRSLKEAGLVVDRAQGRNVFYRVEQMGLAPLADWMGHYSAFWRERFTDLRTLLKEIDK